MRSPGAMMPVVNTPATMPALKSCSTVSSWSGRVCCSRFPMLLPRKQTANMGVTPTSGAAMPDG